MRACPQPDLPEVLVIEPDVHGDERGFFFEAWNEMAFRSLVGIGDVHFVQDNCSRSVRGVLRGIHYQVPPHTQGKLVRVGQGAIWDVAVDLRRSSTTFGAWTGVVLSGENLKQLWIPPGFGHGFLVLTDSVDVLYKTTAYYAPEADRALRWDDAALAIEWPLEGIRPTISAKDAAASLLEDAEVFD